MPFLKRIDIDLMGQLGIWQQDESLDFFEKNLTLSESERKEVSKIKKSRRLNEWYASRYLLHKMMKKEERDTLLKDEFGKPFFKNSGTQFSISHSGDLVAALISEIRCGIDVQEMNPKIRTILPRILSDIEEKKYLGTTDVCYSAFAWSTKEAVYKAYGQKALDFKEHIKILNFNFKESKYFAEVQIKKNDLHLEYKVFGFVIDNYVAVAAFKS